MKYYTSSYEQTYELAREFAKSVRAGTLITLDGDLGAGKTAFTSGFVKGLGCDDVVTSPTFTIVNEYRKGPIPIFHFDVYRLSTMDDLYDIGWEDYEKQDGVIVMEWADIVKSDLDRDYIEIIITKLLDKGEDFREITVTYRGNSNENFSDGHIIG